MWSVEWERPTKKKKRGGFRDYRGFRNYRRPLLFSFSYATHFTSHTCWRGVTANPSRRPWHLVRSKALPLLALNKRAFSRPFRGLPCEGGRQRWVLSTDHLRT